MTTKLGVTDTEEEKWLSGSASKVAVRDLLSGMVSGFFCKIVEYPFDTLKVIMQVCCKYSIVALDYNIGHVPLVGVISNWCIHRVTTDCVAGCLFPCIAIYTRYTHPFIFFYSSWLIAVCVSQCCCCWWWCLFLLFF